MDTKRPISVLWLLGLLVFPTLGCVRDATLGKLIHNNPRDFLLTASDLPAAGEYTLPLHELHPITNECIRYLLGEQNGTERIDRTGRVIGWRVHYTRGNPDAALAQDITQTVVQYACVEGARRSQAEYSLATSAPETGWQTVDSELKLGDAELVEILCRDQSGGSRRISYAVSFTYRNIGVRIELAGEKNQVCLEDTVALARIVLKRLRAAEPCTGPVPTPTPGFEPPEEDSQLYR